MTSLVRDINQKSDYLQQVMYEEHQQERAELGLDVDEEYLEQKRLEEEERLLAEEQDMMDREVPPPGAAAGSFFARSKSEGHMMHPAKGRGRIMSEGSHRRSSTMSSTGIYDDDDFDEEDEEEEVTFRKRIMSEAASVGGGAGLGDVDPNSIHARMMRGELDGMVNEYEPGIMIVNTVIVDDDSPPLGFGGR